MAPDKTNRAEVGEAPRAPEVPVIEDVRLPAYSDEALARRFANSFSSSMRWVETWKCWMTWTGTHWMRDETGLAIAFARGIASEAAAELTSDGESGKLRMAKTIASQKTIQAIERLARYDRCLAARPEIWDNDIWLLNTPLGVIDLKTGIQREHRPSDYQTKITAVGPGGECPRFLKFLDSIFPNDSETISFLRRLLGYCLTGSTREQSLFFFHGTGGNGKGVFLNTIQNALGTYAKTAPASTFVASKFERHPADLAMLQGARLVVGQETEEGQHWAQSRIKSLTGGDEITARHLYQDFFTYTPQFALIIASNHKPALRNVDEAVRRRFKIVSFNVTVPAEKRDPDLAEALQAEWPGILAWMVEGCLEWQRNGLGPSPAVTSATNNYLLEEDTLQKFLNECCELASLTPDQVTPTRTIFQEWVTWCEAGGEFPGSEKRFSRALAERGYIRIQHPQSRQACFEGLRLKTTRT